MAKKVKTQIKLRIPAAAANPAPPVGPALGQHGVNIMDFCKQFNARTQQATGVVTPVLLTVYSDRSFDFVTKTPPASVLLKMAVGLAKGSGEPNRNKVGKVTMAQVRKIARENGESVSGAVGDQIAQTLRAAMASDDAAAAVRDGTLAEALDEPGFGGFSIESAARAPSPKSSGRGKSQPKAEPAGDRAAEEGAAEEAAAEEAAARAAARARIKSAAADVKRVEKALAATTKRRDVLGRDRDRLASQLAQVDDELVAARAEVDDLEAQLGDAAAELEAAGGSPTS